MKQKYTATEFGANVADVLSVWPGPLPVEMYNSDGTAKPLLKHGAFGADLIRFAAGQGVAMHKHPGAHLLFVLEGRGFVDYGGDPHPLKAGLCYLVPENQPHAIRATSPLTMLAVANDHRPAGSLDRMTPIE